MNIEGLQPRSCKIEDRVYIQLKINSMAATNFNFEEGRKKETKAMIITEIKANMKWKLGQSDFVSFASDALVLVSLNT